MKSQQAQRVIVGVWLGVVALATVRSVSTRGGLPPPSVYLGSGVLFTMFYGASTVAPTLAATISAGVLVGALLTPYLRGSTVGPLNSLAALLDGISGADTPVSATPASPGVSTA